MAIKNLREHATYSLSLAMTFLLGGPAKESKMRIDGLQMKKKENRNIYQTENQSPATC